MPVRSSSCRPDRARADQFTTPRTPVRTGVETSRTREYVYDAVAALPCVNRLSARMEIWYERLRDAFASSITAGNRVDRCAGAANPLGGIVPYSTRPFR